jgi:hypothetical protein
VVAGGGRRGVGDLGLVGLIGIKSAGEQRAPLGSGDHTRSHAMGAALIGAVVGLVLGAATGTEIGAFAGAALGMLAGLSLHALFWMRSHLGDAPTVERHRVMCTPLGSVAECELVGDLERGRWYDVKSCSLLQPATQVDCEKGCIRRITHAGVRPGGTCSCHPSRAEPGASAEITS